MNLRIKTKLSLGLAFLFTVIVLIGAVGLYSINRLAEESKTILKANYESLQFSKEMLQALDKIEMNDTSGWKKFESSLNAQENNITEVGEKEITADLNEMYFKLKNASGDKSTFIEIRQGIYHVLELNMNAIVRKNNEAQQTAGKARVYLAIIGTFCFLVSFSFILNFPGYIANPVKVLSEGIKAISNKNYSQRIHLKKGDEFGELAEAFNAMAQKLDDYENSNLAKIIFEKKRIETIINNMSDPVIGFDEKNRILFVNTSAIKILGIPEEDFIGKYAPDVAMKNDLLRNLITQSGSLTPLKIFANNKESYFTKEVVSISSDGQAIGNVIMLRNITQFKELDVSKTNFIATISHELKTPISSIKMSVKLLADKRVGEMNSEQAGLVDNIRSDTERLLKITGELLDLAQVESGEIHLQKLPVDPAQIVNYAYNAMKFQAEQKEVEVRITMEPELPEINCDLEKTAWVLVNFLSNAIRYSPEKSEIRIDVKKENGQMRFSVQDSGKGIDPKYKERIFEKFYQVPSTDTTKTGTGLGLAISKDFIEAQGGKIWVDSEIGEGSTFSFSLSI